MPDIPGELREYHEGEQPDTLWNFVESRSEFVGEPALPLINDFAILDWEEDFDVVPDILADSGYVCVIAIENVEKASVSRVDKINELYDPLLFECSFALVVLHNQVGRVGQEQVRPLHIYPTHHLR